MPSFHVETPQRSYDAVVERGCISRAAEFIPPKAGIVFVVTTKDVWDLHGKALDAALAKHEHRVLFFPGGEARKRMSEVETLADQMVELGADRTSLVIAFGGGIVGDLGGFLAAIFLRGIPVIQIPTTLLAQVDAGMGGKTGANLAVGKNLIGAFHQPLAVLIDPDMLRTLPEREFRAGLYEIIKAGIIRDQELFHLMDHKATQIFAQDPTILENIIAAAVRIKAEVVTADEREGDLRRILNFGHTIGHVLEAETHYERFLHGEAVAFGMHAVTDLAGRLGTLAPEGVETIHRVVAKYGPIPSVEGIPAPKLLARLRTDKKTVQGKVHFVLPKRIGEVQIVSGVDEGMVLASIDATLKRVSATAAA